MDVAGERWRTLEEVWEKENAHIRGGAKGRTSSLSEQDKRDLIELRKNYGYGKAVKRNVKVA